MKIIDYDTKYDEDIKDLLVELQEYIASIDKERYNVLTNEYRDIQFKKTMNEIKHYEGKMLLAIDNNKAIGLVVGLINNDDQSTYDFKSPKRAKITELVVSSNYRSKGIGKQLLKAIEEYFKSVGCKAILIEVFAYNTTARAFYSNNNYSDRNLEVMKQI